MQDGLTRYVKFLSTPSARRATPRGKQATESTAISIHALREEGDVQAGTVLGASGPISIHALREEGDRRVVPLFGLTLYFYPRPPRGGRPPSQDRRGTTQNFYPRPPRGGRLGCRWALSRASRFLSTPSARRATGDVDRVEATIDISIHALREEGDDLPCSRYLEIQDLYPRPPRGGRQGVQLGDYHTLKFLSTPSARRATRLIRTMEGFRKYFYPRPPRGGRPARSGLQNQPRGYFYPRPPRGGRPGKCVDWLHFQKISIHALREEGDNFRRGKKTKQKYFYPRPPRGGRR